MCRRGQHEQQWTAHVEYGRRKEGRVRRAVTPAATTKWVAVCGSVVHRGVLLLLVLLRVCMSWRCRRLVLLAHRMDGLAGLSAFCSTELRKCVPTSPFFTGHSTWMSMIGSI